VCSILAGAAVAAAGDVRNFDLPADAAEASLKRLAGQSGLEVLFTTEMTEGIRTRAVRGQFTPIAAANRMLTGTQLLAEQDSRTGAITIHRSPNAPAEKKAAGRPAGPSASASEAAAPSLPGKGVLSGRVIDRNTGAFLAGATIEIDGDFVAQVDRDGTFTLRSLSVGPRVVTVSYVGYEARTETTTIAAGETTRIEMVLSPEIIQLQAVIVEGAREGQARAINEQRSATNLRNIVSADAIGNFPDVNAAEALKRLPGISTVRQRGEDRDITIRGAAPDLNAITLDGVSVLSNQVNGRTVSMDVFPAEQLAGVEIVKSSTPNMDGDSIGGTINLRSKSAFDSSDRVLNANAYWQYNELAEQSSYRAGLTFSDTFGAERGWGLQLSASRAQRKALEETTEPGGWASRSGTAAGAAYNGYAPNNIPFSYVDIKRERTGGSIALERKFGETRLYLRVSHNEFVERNGRPRFVLQNAGSIAASLPVTVEGDRIVNYTSTSLRGQRVVNPREFTDTSSTVALGGRTVFNDWTIEAVGAWARGTNHQDSVTGQWQTSGNTTATIDLRDSARPLITRTAGIDLNDPSAYAFSQLQIQDRRLRNLEYSFKVDASRTFPFIGHPLKLSTGGKIRWSPKRWDQENQQFNSLASGTLALSDSRLGGTYETKAGFLDDLLAFGPTVAPYSFYEFAKGNVSLFTPNAGSTLQNTLAADYYVAEGIYAGYAMGEWTRGPLTILAGLRYERTEVESKAWRQNNGLPTSNPARYTWARNDSSFDNVLPGLHLRYAPNKKLVLRASWNNTLSRPAANRISPSLNISTPAVVTDSDRITVTGGNPNLKATESANVDLSAEYYLKSIGLVSAGFFRKQVDGSIYRKTFDGTYEGQPARLTVFDNAGRATVTGWEFSYQQQLSFLPGPLSGLGVYANFTMVDSEVVLTEPGRVGEILPLFNQSDELGNLALTYQKYGLFVRIAHNWRGDYLQALGNPGLDQFARGFESYDLLASYKINRRWSLKFEANNLTNGPERQYVGTSERNLYFGDTGRSYAFGLVFNY